MSLTVKAFRIGAVLNRLDVFDGEVFVGEYERSQDADVERKRREVDHAGDLLLWVFRKYGRPFQVRWNAAGRYKSIRIDDAEVAIVPKALWETPTGKS